MMKRMAVLAMAATAGVGLAQEWDAGFDARVREERLDRIPTSNGLGKMAKRDYLRIRTRGWFEMTSEEGTFSLYGRVAQEVRAWFEGEGAKQTSSRWPDETVLDSLYFQGMGLFGEGSRVRIGRQDIRLGSGRLVLDGRPGDGSRTASSDGVTVKVSLSEKQAFEAFAIYNHSDNELAIGNIERPWMTAYRSGRKMDESGVGLYYTDRAEDAFGYDLFGIVKHDGVTTSVDGNRTKLASAATIYTAGFRVLPKFTETLSAEVEAAYQLTRRLGRDDGREAGMVFASTTWAPEAQWKPTFAIATIYESAEWNPLWGRWPVWGELPVLTYDFGVWHDLVHPYVEAKVSPAKGHKVAAKTGPMYSEKRGPAGGRYKGWYAQARWDFPLASGLLKRGDASRKDVLEGHITGELLKAGDYTPFSDTAYFLRWEITYAF
ncbi:MAG: hypothetical protein FWF84_06715 [Kiritimatiellaeota bacterium]|nr:hypothetical protein [Kiritimatiellota bacterium]